MRADLPTGTVTFLFTDIEGSTRLLDVLGDRYPALLESHQRILREAFGGRGGIDVSTEGDSFFVVFRTAPQAVAAAVEAQRAIAAHESPPGTAARSWSPRPPGPWWSRRGPRGWRSETSVSTG